MIDNILDTIGQTPLIRLAKTIKTKNLQANLLAKVEAFNPGGSAKDRVALRMIDEAETDGRLQPGATIIEPTSGNTGVGLALVSAVRGYHLILTMPETMSVERRRLVAAYGAEVVLTPGDQGMSGAIARAEQLRDSIPGSVILGQFTNPGNPAAHYRTTGPEIWKECNVDVFVAGIGTGGTITGTAKYLKEQKPSVEVIGIEPAGSPFLTEGRSGRHDLQGIGAGFKPDILDLSVIDRVVTVTDEDAYAGARYLASQEGILCGITSGAAMHAGMQLAQDPAYRGRNIVILLTDTGERYLSTKLFE
ncbi:MAG: cysteine synthase A [Bacteroidaceae bacterium]|nr:cysteine synthase A [Bacteroidaceae bacterium]